jgi:hypothetical protein
VNLSTAAQDLDEKKADLEPTRPTGQQNFPQEKFN